MDTQYLHIETLDFMPDLLAIHAAKPDYYPHLLASNAEPKNQSRYSILFACPQESIFKKDDESFLDTLDEHWQAEKIEPLTSALPFTGGWYLYLSYELAGEVEPSLKLSESRCGLPVAMATRIPAAIIIDHKEQCAYIVCEQAYVSCVKQIQWDASNLSDSNVYHHAIQVRPLQEDDEAVYFSQLKKIKQYIVDGDVFQVNLSRAWQTSLLTPVNHASLYYQLVKNNPGPFNALSTFGEQSIISSSPERLIEVRNGYIETRPIAGTRPRSDNDKNDLDLSAELLAHPKEKAEHIMLIDLERNDLGRICEAGSVEVNELMALETYQHVHHIVSNVRGRVKKSITPGQLIKAVFPGGTITGCPKVRCMEILSELENVERGAYTGSLGYLNRDGSMDLNILIRTIVRDKKTLTFRAGGGIVADSDARHELNETRAKAKGLIMALNNNE